MELNKEALKQLAEKEKPVRAHIAGVQKALLKGYERVLGDEPSRQETSFSLRAIGCFQAGLHQQVCSQHLPKYAALRFDTRVRCRYCCPPCCSQILQSGEHFPSVLTRLWDRIILFVRMNGSLFHNCCHPGLMLLTLHLIPCEASPKTGTCCQPVLLSFEHRFENWAASEGDVIALSSINDRAQVFIEYIVADHRHMCRMAQTCGERWPCCVGYRVDSLCPAAPC